MKYTRKGLLEVRRKVGIVFQEPDDQLFSASVYQEISFGILNLGADEKTTEREVNRVIEELGITPFRDRPAHALSGGQKKLVAIADILVMHPEVMILDEPTAALDPKHTRIVQKIIDRLTERGITVLMATHDMDYAYSWADEIVLMHEGKVLRSGTPAEVCSDTEALEKTNLEMPSVLRLYHIMTEKGILPAGDRPPENMKELEGDCRNEKGNPGGEFRTSHLDTMKKTIDVIEKEIAEKFDGCRVYRAFTSGMIIRKLKRTENMDIDTVSEALKRMGGGRNGRCDRPAHPYHQRD